MNPTGAGADGGRGRRAEDNGHRHESDELQVPGGRGQEHSLAGSASRTATGGSVLGTNSEGFFLIAPRTLGHWSAKITAGVTEKDTG